VYADYRNACRWSNPHTLAAATAVAFQPKWGLASSISWVSKQYFFTGWSSQPHAQPQHLTCRAMVSFDVELHLWFRSRGAGTASRAWCSDTTFTHVVCAAGKYTLLRRGNSNPFPLSCQKVIINHVITYSETNATSSISSAVDRLDVILHYFNGAVVDWTCYIFFSG
jgi:hypothetical protein